MKYTKPVVIFNKNSKGGTNSKKFKVFSDKIDSHFPGSRPFYYSPESFEATEKFIKDFCNNGEFDLIISIGGDGTLSSISNALMKVDYDKRVPILPIPGGSGNSLFIDFDISNIDDSFKKFTDDSYTVIDILKVNTTDREFYCLNILGMGFISDIAEFAVEKKKKFGAFAYILAPFFGLKKFKPYNTTITLDNNELFKSEKVFFLTVSNNKYTGANFKVAPDADMRDGLADVVVLHDINRFSFLLGFLKVFSGNHIKQKGCICLKSNHVKITSTPNYSLMPDGELHSMSPVEINVLSKQIKLAITL